MNLSASQGLIAQKVVGRFKRQRRGTDVAMNGPLEQWQQLPMDFVRFASDTHFGNNRHLFAAHIQTC